MSKTSARRPSRGTSAGPAAAIKAAQAAAAASATPTQLRDRPVAPRRDEQGGAGPVGGPGTFSSPRPPLDRLDSTAAGRAVLAALHDAVSPAKPDEPTLLPTAPSPMLPGAAAGATPSGVTRPKEVAAAAAASAPAARTVSASAVGGRTAVLPQVATPAPAARPTESWTFAPRRGARRVLTVAVAVAVLATVATALTAYRQTSDTAYLLAAVGAALSLVLWSARERATGAQVSIEGGRLRIVQGPSQHQFPLDGVYPPIDVLGAPGQRDWRVLIQRKGMAPYEITSRMVDPVGFTEALRRFRPHA